MFQILKSSRQSNPLYEIVDLIPLEATLVALPFLDKIARVFYQHTGYKFDTYGEVFELLEFLQENGVIELETIPESNLTTIARIYYGETL